MAGCESGDLRSEEAAQVGLFADQSVDLTEASAGPAVVSISSRLVGISADGGAADLVIDWELNVAAHPAIDHATRLAVVMTTTEGERRVLFRERIATGATRGEIDLVVPTSSDIASITVGLEELVDGIVDDLPAYATLILPGILTTRNTPLEQIVGLHAALQANSYRSAVEDGRRMHRFTIRVEADLDGSASGPAGRVSVTGLDQASSDHFIALENGYDDPESSVVAAYQAEPITVFLVMDVSSSVSLAGAADELVDAVSRSLLTLAPVSRFDLRVFDSNVRKIDSVRDIDFDTSGDSGTAFYRALDTTLDDIESIAGDVVIIGFTDGRDLSSRNFYPQFLSHEQVLGYVADRLRNVGDARRQFQGNRFEAHFVSLGSNIDVNALQRLAVSGTGSHFPSYATGSIDQAFAHLTDSVRGVYELEYSSQQLAGDAPLVLQVQANGLSALPIDLPTRSGLAPSN